MRIIIQCGRVWEEVQSGVVQWKKIKRNELAKTLKKQLMGKVVMCGTSLCGWFDTKEKLDVVKRDSFGEYGEAGDKRKMIEWH